MSSSTPSSSNTTTTPSTSSLSSHPELSKSAQVCCNVFDEDEGVKAKFVCELPLLIAEEVEDNAPPTTWRGKGVRWNGVEGQQGRMYRERVRAGLAELGIGRHDDADDDAEQSC
jgi:hypothetical protein